MPREAAEVLRGYGPLDAAPLEKITLEVIDRIPVDLSLRCLYIVYCTKFATGSSEVHKSAAFEKRKDKDGRDIPFIMHLRGMMLAIDILNMQLIAVRATPCQWWNKTNFSEFPQSVLEKLTTKNKLDMASGMRVAKEMNLTLVTEIPAYLKPVQGQLL